VKSKIELHNRLRWQEDMVVDVESPDTQASIDTTVSMPTQARDIYVGEMRLACGGKVPDDFCEEALTQVSITLPVEGNRPANPDNALSLLLLTIILGVNSPAGSSKSTRQIYLRFVRLLPKFFSEYFAQFR
jgi:hypothetical protein